jgi:hypothetical protein
LTQVTTSAARLARAANDTSLGRGDATAQQQKDYGHNRPDRCNQGHWLCPLEWRNGALTMNDGVTRDPGTKPAGMGLPRATSCFQTGPKVVQSDIAFLASPPAPNTGLLHNVESFHSGPCNKNC